MNNPKKLLTALLLLILAHTSFGQTTGSISGEIKDAQKNAISSASIALLNQLDSSVVKNVFGYILTASPRKWMERTLQLTSKECHLQTSKPSKLSQTRVPSTMRPA